ncbi:MAG: glycosyl hydrolase family 18 protein [Gemmatimonadota bacterium]|jgi:spore germination protein YaaH
MTAFAASIRRRTISLARPAALAITVASTLFVPDARAQDVERLFYYVDRESSYESFVANVDRIDILAPSSYNIDEDGVVYGQVDPTVLELARERGIRVMPLLVNRGFDQEKLTTFLEDEEARARVISALVELCRRHDYDGIQLDIENLSIHDRDLFTAFYRDAARALHAEGYRISAAVVHRPDDLSGATPYQEWLFDSWRGGYDLAALAEIGDFLSVMTYSQHTRRTPPGPQAGLPWMEDVIDFFLEHMPPEKLSLGIAVGSPHWFTSYEERITPELARSYNRVETHAWATHLIDRHGAELVWDDEQKVSYAYFSVEGTWEWIFLEDARSFEARLDLVRSRGLRGFSVWVLGYEDPELWGLLPARSGR